MKVSHDDDGKATYRVGDVTIVADAPKTTVTEDGKTVVIGKIGNLAASHKTARGIVA
ncbi:hypothetical protein [Nitratireductor sp. XY-223]|uniref:hypothetical protein n=1 Tax=Nitratireductor sp. XY-223 TaxID=2561926 RepID=UPI00145BFE1E|nr:hypothetical protein [Nitratireductor sp. XY-223]